MISFTGRCDTVAQDGRPWMVNMGDLEHHAATKAIIITSEIAP